MNKYAMLKNTVSRQKIELQADTIVEVLDNSYRRWKIRYNDIIVDEIEGEVLHFFDHNNILPAAVAKKLSDKEHRHKTHRLVKPIVETLMSNIIKAISGGTHTATVKKRTSYMKPIWQL